jgi:hypothetical protein
VVVLIWMDGSIDLQKRLPNGYFGNSMRQCANRAQSAKRDRCARSAPPPEVKTAREARSQQDSNKQKNER